MKIDLTGRSALVTGSTRGIGRAIAETLAECGAKVGVVGRDEARAKEAAAAISPDSRGFACDVADAAAVAALVERAEAELGAVDILVNNAGISGPVGPLWQAQTAEWWRAIEVNLGGAFVLTQLALEHMIPAGRGRIINITSYAGVYRWPLLSAYAASKAALVKLTETLAEETRPHGVSVFSVDPGLLPIGLGEAALKASADRRTPEGRVQRWIRDQLAAGRGADPEEAARLIIALASGRADRLSGRHLSVTDRLDVLLPRIDQIERDDLHTLRLRTGH
jgi:NAD(P)-dependent dehydrogenase (short-subunit alcohol dehydrogenase family)